MVRKTSEPGAPESIAEGIWPRSNNLIASGPFVISSLWNGSRAWFLQQTPFPEVSLAKFGTSFAQVGMPDQLESLHLSCAADSLSVIHPTYEIQNFPRKAGKGFAAYPGPVAKFVARYHCFFAVADEGLIIH